jgi:hypothetical protein
MRQKTAGMVYNQSATILVTGIDHLSPPFNADGERFFNHDDLDTRFCGFDDRLMVMKIVGRDTYDINGSVLVHRYGTPVAVFRGDFPLVPKLLQSLGIDVRDSHQIRFLTPSIAPSVGIGPSAKPPDTPCSDDANPDFGR